MKKFIDDVQDTILTCRNSNLGQYYIDAEKLLSDFLLEEMRMMGDGGVERIQDEMILKLQFNPDTNKYTEDYR